MKNINNDKQIIPGDLFEIKTDKDNLYFLCTTTHIDHLNNIHFIGFTNEATLDFNGLNLFSFRFQNDMGLDEEISIYYTCNSDFTKCTTRGWISKNKKNEYIYNDCLNRTSSNISYVVRIPLNLLHGFYQVKDRCSYYIFKKSTNIESDIFNAGSVYSYENNYLIAMRKGIIDDELYGFYLKIINNGYSSGFKMKMSDIESNIAKNIIKPKGYVSPLYFRSIFDIYTEGGNPSLNIKEILVEY